MSVGSSAEILVLSNIQAKALAGSLLAIGEDLFRLKDYDPAYPGQPPWRSGAEGKAYPLLARDGTVAAYLKFFTRPTQSRLNRTAWLIGQQMHTWLPGLSAAPLLWVDTRLSPRSAEIDFDFAGYLAQAVPGETWQELKHHIVETGVSLPADVRWRCVEDLVLATAVLERADIVHGDLSPNNIVIDPAAPAGDPALCLIDFDAFVAPAAGPDRAVDLAAGGTYGTEGYCPPDLGARAAAGDGSAAPYSDRYGRDVLILELLLMDPGFSPDDPPAIWDRQRLGRAYAQWRASCGKGGQSPFARTAPAKGDCPPFPLAHLDLPEVFSLSEAQRPSSMRLAAGLGLELPEAPVICTDLPVPRSPSDIPGIRSVSAQVQQRRRRRTRAPARPQGRQAAPSKTQPLSHWLASAQVVPRKLRRVRQRAAAPKDDPGSVIIVIAVIAIIWLVLFLVPLSSCHLVPGAGP